MVPDGKPVSKREIEFEEMDTLLGGGPAIKDRRKLKQRIAQLEAELAALRLSWRGDLYVQRAVADLTQKCGQLEAENAVLKAENAALKARIETLESIMMNEGKLDEILRLLQKPQAVSFVSPVVSRAAPEDGVVEVDAPTFVQSSTIKSKDTETRVEVSSETSQGSSVSGASTALRRLRQGQ